MLDSVHPQTVLLANPCVTLHIVTLEILQYIPVVTTFAFPRSESGIFALTLAKIPRFWMDTR